jgi:hypothetical protein
MVIIIKGKAGQVPAAHTCILATQEAAIRRIMI